MPNADGGADPGIIAGAMLQIPNAGNYEIYAVYTLAAQESLLNAMYKVLLASVVVLFLHFNFIDNRAAYAVASD